MNKYVLGIDGMSCGMCESHVQDVIRRNIDVKKVKASHLKKNVEIITEKELDESEFKKIIDQTGYIITSYKKEEAVKKLLGWK